MKINDYGGIIMVSDKIVVKNDVKLVLDKIRKFVSTFKELSSNCDIQFKNESNGVIAHANKIDEIIALCSKAGTVLTVTCEGENEAEILPKVIEIIKTIDRD